MPATRPSFSLPVLRPIKRRIIGEVQSTFNDRSRGEATIERRDDGLFGRDSIAWRVHGDVASMMVGGVAALLLQMLQPAALAGVWDHSNFRADMLGRLRRTARFIALTTYASRPDAEAAIARVRAIHARVTGTLPDGTPYRADDPRLLAWVHVTESLCFLGAWIRYGEPAMTALDQDRYFAEVAQVGLALGADPVPRSRAEAEALIAAFRRELRSDARTRAVARIVLDQPMHSLVTAPFQALTFRAAVDLLPGWARRMHGLPTSTATLPLLRAGTYGIAATLRWAFR